MFNHNKFRLFYILLCILLIFMVPYLTDIYGTLPYLYLWYPMLQISIVPYFTDIYGTLSYWYLGYLFCILLIPMVPYLVAITLYLEFFFVTTEQNDRDCSELTTLCPSLKWVNSNGWGILCSIGHPIIISFFRKITWHFLWKPATWEPGV